MKTKKRSACKAVASIDSLLDARIADLQRQIAELRSQMFELSLRQTTLVISVPQQPVIPNPYVPPFTPYTIGDQPFQNMQGGTISSHSGNASVQN